MQYSVVPLSKQEPVSLRLDAEYYRPAYLQVESLLKNQEWDYLENLTTSIKSFGAYSLTNQIEYKENGIPFLRCKDIKAGIIDFSDVLFINDDASKLLWKSEVKPETVLFTMSGTVGNSAIATKELAYPINSNQDIAKITTNKKLNPYYFSIFLQSKHGELQVSRLPIGSVQQHIFLWQLEKMIIPLFSVEFQKEIEGFFKRSLQATDNAANSFSQAQNLLLTELGFANWQPKQHLSFVRNSSDVEQAGRIDAEYFQPKYDEIVKAIKTYAGGWDNLANLVNYKKQNFVPKEKQEYRYIELANIAGNGEITGCTIEEGQNLPSRARRKVAKGDVIVSSIEGSLSSIALVGEEYHQALCSTGFHIINSPKINSETLLVLLKSKIGQLQLKKGCSGTILTAINNDEFSRIILPVISKDKQLEIQQKVSESFALRVKSKQLLESAKRAVEMAIEEGEEKALTWLKEQAE